MLVLRYVLAVLLVVPAVYILMNTIVASGMIRKKFQTRLDVFYFVTGVVQLGFLAVLMVELFSGQRLFTSLQQADILLQICTAWYLGCMYGRAEVSYATLIITKPEKEREQRLMRIWAAVNSLIVIGACVYIETAMS